MCFLVQVQLFYNTKSPRQHFVQFIRAHSFYIRQYFFAFAAPDLNFILYCFHLFFSVSHLEAFKCFFSVHLHLTCCCFCFETARQNHSSLGQMEARINPHWLLWQCLICAVNSVITCPLFSTYHIWTGSTQHPDCAAFILDLHAPFLQFFVLANVSASQSYSTSSSWSTAAWQQVAVHLHSVKGHHCSVWAWLSFTPSCCALQGIRTGQPLLNPSWLLV